MWVYDRSRLSGRENQTAISQSTVGSAARGRDRPSSFRNYGVYGVRKMHALMRRQGWALGRDQTGRIMRNLGIAGVKRSKRVFTTKSDPAGVKPKDLVQRRFTAPAPCRLCRRRSNSGRFRRSKSERFRAV